MTADERALGLRALRVDGFRNLDGVEIVPTRRVSVFVGDNGTGKTSLLEAVDYVSTLRSFRGASRRQLVGHDRQRATIALDVGWSEPASHYRVVLDRTSRDVRIDGKHPGRAIEYFGRAACVVFQPEDLALVRGEPQIRRRLLDRVLVRTVDGYGESLRTYARALKARNAVLRSEPAARRAGAAFEPTLAREGSCIVRARQAVTASLAQATQEALATLVGDTAVHVAYRTRASGVLDEYQRALADSWPTDRVRKTTMYGPHTDDVSVGWRGQPARAVASQGQARALALALRIAELEVLRASSHRVPWLLLDDVSSELDRTRTERLLQLVDRTGAQTWITTTEIATVSGLADAEFFRVSAGRVGR